MTQYPSGGGSPRDARGLCGVYQADGSPLSPARPWDRRARSRRRRRRSCRPAKAGSPRQRERDRWPLSGPRMSLERADHDDDDQRRGPSTAAPHTPGASSTVDGDRPAPSVRATPVRRDLPDRVRRPGAHLSVPRKARASVLHVRPAGSPRGAARGSAACELACALGDLSSARKSIVWVSERAKPRAERRSGWSASSAFARRRRDRGRERGRRAPVEVGATNVTLGERDGVDLPRVIGSGLELDGERIQLSAFTSDGGADRSFGRIAQPSRRR